MLQTSLNVFVLDVAFNFISICTYRETLENRSTIVLAINNNNDKQFTFVFYLCKHTFKYLCLKQMINILFILYKI